MKIEEYIYEGQSSQKKRQRILEQTLPSLKTY